MQLKSLNILERISLKVKGHLSSALQVMVVLKIIGHFLRLSQRSAAFFGSHSLLCCVVHCFPNNHPKSYHTLSSYFRITMQVFSSAMQVYANLCKSMQVCASLSKSFDS